jgi:asparagine synthase (glutamine-hydrolysing)
MHPSSSDPGSPTAAHCRGDVEFSDPALQQMCLREGAARVWTRAADQGLDAFVNLAASARGSFSAIVVGPEGRMALVVDRFGVEPLCWRVDEGRLRADSRADDLASLTPSAGVDLQAIFNYLYFHVIPSPRTVYEGVSRVPPGHVVWFERGVASVRPYWRPQFRPHGGPADFESFKSRFRDTMAGAVRRRADAEKPACYLSGGTDSSTVAGLLAKEFGRVATYSIGFEAEGYDEMQYARIASRHFGTEHHEYYVTARDVLEGMPKVAAHFDQPFGNSSAVPAYYCAQLAASDGCRRLLAGDGGDELFGGNSRYAKQRLFELYAPVPGWLRRSVDAALALPGIGSFALARKARSYVEQARTPMPDRLDLYNLLSRVGAANVLAAPFLARINASAPGLHQREVWQSADTDSWLNRHLAFDWRYTLAEADLPKVVGSAGLAGMQVAFPLIDDELISLSTELPDNYKLRDGQLRWFFKQALVDFLPAEIITKQKHGFGLPFGVWAHAQPALGNRMRELLASLRERGILRPGFDERLMRDLLPQHPGYYGELIWILAMLELWFQRARPTWQLRE